MQVIYITQTSSALTKSKYTITASVWGLSTKSCSPVHQDDFLKYQKSIQVDEIAQQVRMLAAMSSDLGLILGTHTVEVNNFCKVFSDLHMCPVTGTHRHTLKEMKMLQRQFYFYKISPSIECWRLSNININYFKKHWLNILQ